MKPTVAAMLCESGTEKDLDNPLMAASLKFDGTRAWLGKSEGKGFVINRKNVDYTDRLPEIIEVIEAMPVEDFTIDGELVYYDENGRSLFEGSQRRCSTQDMNKQREYRVKYPLVFETWDIISLDGKDQRGMTWKSRDYLLSELLRETKQNTIRYVENTYDEAKRKLYEKVTEQGEEGVILKNMNSTYVGKRSSAWLKVKKMYSERCKIVGYTEGTGSRADYFGSLILARPDDQGILRYCGKVGSGFSAAEVRHMYEVLQTSTSDEPQVDVRDGSGKPIDYTPVTIVTEITVRFYETSKNGVFRFPSILKDRQGNNMIHWYDSQIKGTPKVMDLKSLLEGLK